MDTEAPFDRNGKHEHQLLLDVLLHERTASHQAKRQFRCWLSEPEALAMAVARWTRAFFLTQECPRELVSAFFRQTRQRLLVELPLHERSAFDVALLRAMNDMSLDAVTGQRLAVSC